MASSKSEDVLLIVPSVWHKKSAGSIYLMSERIAWMSDSKSVFQISHKYIDIKLQKVSLDTKPKVQLQLVMHNNEANTFNFNNPNGREACVLDREKVKEMLVRLLPQFRNKINSELERKHKLLQENQQLFQLYNDLVVSGIISAEEFWVNRTQLSHEALSAQKVGISQDFFTQIKPESSGTNSLSYNLTTDTMEAIFRTYPQVSRKHVECVPHHMTESEFWTKFFQSHYFHRDRINPGSKDLFYDCDKQDKKDMEDDILDKAKREWRVNLDEFSDHHLGESYEESSSERISHSTTNQTIIKRFNHHSLQVLKTAEQSSGSAGDSSVNPVAGGSKGSSGPTQKRMAEDDGDYDDLVMEKPPDKKSIIHLSKTDRYFHGPVPQTNHSKYRSTEDMIHAAQAVAQEVSGWTDTTRCTLTPDVARDILTQLSPGGSLMTAHTQQSGADMCPLDVKTELRNLYCALNELLRHFWACFPAQTKQLADKLIRMEQNLNRFNHSKLIPFKEKIQRYSFSFNLTDHIEAQLQAALLKYSKWYSKKMHKSASTPTLSNMAK